MAYLEQEKKEVEYIIYVRKSTDEASGKQQQSIPDQMEACLRFARNE